jgi:two-component system sensor histidine kinase BaeS
MSGGNRNARVGELLGAPSELGELAATFDTMADTIHAEEQLRRDLVADVAHELRTPVAVLQANCEALLDGVVARTPAQIASLHEEVVRLARMVEDLQTLSSAQAAALHLAREPCDLADIARTAAAGMASTADAAGVRLSTRLESAPIDGDPVRVHQIITNLLSNAIKFSGDGSTTTLAVRAGSGGAVLVVSDGGRGIDPADLPFVFERFWRSDPTNGPPGSGIGLAVARDLVVAHGGTIDIESTPGSGTRVTVRLPSHR